VEPETLARMAALFDFLSAVTASRGVVYELSFNGTYSVLHEFDYAGGWAPGGGLVRDAAGNLYGTRHTRRVPRG
jgi:hypothetical protein